GEEIRLDRIDAGPADVRAVDAEDIIAGRTPGDLVQGDAVADVAGGRRRGGRVPFQERSDVGRGQDEREVTGGRNRGATRGRGGGGRTRGPRGGRLHPRQGGGPAALASR